MSHFVVLIVENDTLQREAVADLLKAKGLEVVECTTAEAAELVLAATGRELLALVTDVNLDGTMTGTELAEYAKDQYPQMNVIVISGAARPDLPENTCFLQKPYDYGDLLDAVLHE